MRAKAEERASEVPIDATIRLLLGHSTGSAAIGSTRPQMWYTLLHFLRCSLSADAHDHPASLSAIARRGGVDNAPTITPTPQGSSYQRIEPLPPGAYDHGHTCPPSTLPGGVHCETFHARLPLTARFHLLCRPISPDTGRFVMNTPPTYVDGRCPEEHFCASYYPRPEGRRAGHWTPASMEPMPQIRCVYFARFEESSTRLSKSDMRRNQRERRARRSIHRPRPIRPYDRASHWFVQATVPTLTMKPEPTLVIEPQLIQPSPITPAAAPVTAMAIVPEFDGVFEGLEDIVPSIELEIDPESPRGAQPRARSYSWSKADGSGG